MSDAFIYYGDRIEVWTFTGWEVFEWDAYECADDAYAELSGISEWRFIEEESLNE